MYRIGLMLVILPLMLGLAKGQQLKNALSLDGGINRMKPESSTETGWYVLLHWNIGLGKGFSFSPHIGLDQLKAENDVNFQLYQIGLGGKYYLTDRFAFRLSANFAMVDDVWHETTVDIYPSLSASYDLPLAARHSFAFTLRDDFTGSLMDYRPFRNLLAFGVAYTFWYGR